MWASIIVTIVILAIVGIIVGVLSVLKTYRRKAEEAGFSSLGDYLRAAPCSDVEKQEAVDLALKGLVLCVVGLAFPPLLLIGVFPLYFGMRKVAYWSMGLGLFEDPDQSEA